VPAGKTDGFSDPLRPSISGVRHVLLSSAELVGCAEILKI